MLVSARYNKLVVDLPCGKRILTRRQELNVRRCGVQRDMQARRETAVADDDHDEAKQMMLRLGHGLVDCPDIGGRGRRNRLRVRMPVTDKMEPLAVHIAYFSLFLAAVWNVGVARTMIGGSRTRNF